jgi:hypothetical protein
MIGGLIAAYVVCTLFFMYLAGKSKSRFTPFEYIALVFFWPFLLVLAFGIRTERRRR